MENKKLLGKRIKEIRKQTSLTQEKLAELIGIDITTLSGIESGRHFPSLVTLEKISKILNCELQALFDFNQFLPVDVMRKEIIKSIDLISDDDIKFIYKLVHKKYTN